MTTPRMPKHSRRTYNIVVVEDGTYAVEVKAANAPPLRVSGFASEEEARRWIEREAE